MRCWFTFLLMSVAVGVFGRDYLAFDLSPEGASAPYVVTNPTVSDYTTNKLLMVKVDTPNPADAFYIGVFEWTDGQAHVVDTNLTSWLSAPPDREKRPWFEYSSTSVNIANCIRGLGEGFSAPTSNQWAQAALGASHGVYEFWGQPYPVDASEVEPTGVYGILGNASEYCSDGLWRGGDVESEGLDPLEGVTGSTGFYGLRLVYMPPVYSLTVNGGTGSQTGLPAGTLVTATASEPAGYGFVSWQPGNITENPYSFNIVSNTTLTATFAPYTISVTGGVAVTNEVAGTITITPTIPAGEYFTGWTGTTNTPTAELVYPFPLDRRIVITANFEPYTLTLTGGVAVTNETYHTITITPSIPENAYFTGWTGSTTTSTERLIYDFPLNQNLVLTANFLPYYTFTVIGGNGSRTELKSGDQVRATSLASNNYEFVSWQPGNITDDPYTFNIVSNTTLTATYVRMVQVAVTGGIGDGRYRVGSSVTITADTFTDRRFTGWSVTYEGTDPQIPNTPTATFVIPEGCTSITAVAQFVQLTTLQVTGGTVVPLKSSYVAGDQITVTATVPEGQIFAGWYIDWRGSANPNIPNTNPTTFTIPEGCTRIILEAQIGRLTSIEVHGGTASPLKRYYAAGDVVTLTEATPAEGQRFKRWVSDPDWAAGDIVRSTYTVPSTGRAVTFTAEYEYVPSTNVTVSIVGGTLSGSTVATTDAPFGYALDRWTASRGSVSNTGVFTAPAAPADVVLAPKYASAGDYVYFDLNALTNSFSHTMLEGADTNQTYNLVMKRFEAQHFFMSVYEFTQGQRYLLDRTAIDGGAMGRFLPVQWALNQAGIKAAAETYCTKLSTAFGPTFTLPTEAQWRLAAGAYPTNAIANYAVYSGNPAVPTTKFPINVGTKLASPTGLYDVWGNACELVSDQNYAIGGARDDPATYGNNTLETFKHVIQGTGEFAVAGMRPIVPLRASYTLVLNSVTNTVFEGATIVATAPEVEGKTFTHWLVDGVQAQPPAVMPAANCTITPVYRDNKACVVTVSGGTGSATVGVNTTVGIYVTVPAGQRFVRWEINGGATLANPAAEVTTLTTGSAFGVITVTAIFEPLPLPGFQLKLY